MKHHFLSFTLFVLGVTACQNNNSSERTTGNKIETINSDFSVDDFEKEIQTNPMVQLVDVRTPEEFEQGHLEDALNYNIGSPDFENQINNLDKNQPVLVYCLSGGRSSAAIAIFEQKGFKEVHHLRGGLIKWTAANKPLNIARAKKTELEITSDQFKEFLNTEKTVLVDYNAKWCIPCKKMAPMLNNLADQNKDELRLVTIDADQNKNLLKARGIESIPFFELYKKGKLLWKHEGEIDEITLIQAIKNNH